MFTSTQDIVSDKTSFIRHKYDSNVGWKVIKWYQINKLVYGFVD